MKTTKKIANDLENLFLQVAKEHPITDAQYKAFKIKYMGEDSYTESIKYDMNFVFDPKEFDILEKAVLMLKSFISEKYVARRN